MGNIKRLVTTVKGLGGLTWHTEPSPTTHIFTSYFLVVCAYGIVDENVRICSLCWRDDSNDIVLHPSITEWEWEVDTHFYSLVTGD